MLIHSPPPSATAVYATASLDFAADGREFRVRGAKGSRQLMSCWASRLRRPGWGFLPAAAAAQGRGCASKKGRRTPP